MIYYSSTLIGVYMKNDTYNIVIVFYRIDSMANDMRLLLTYRQEEIVEKTTDFVIWNTTKAYLFYPTIVPVDIGVEISNRF